VLDLDGDQRAELTRLDPSLLRESSLSTAKVSPLQPPAQLRIVSDAHNANPYRNPSSSLRLPPISVLTAAADTFNQVASHFNSPFSRLAAPLAAPQPQYTPRNDAAMPRGRPPSATRTASQVTPPRPSFTSGSSKTATSRISPKQTPKNTPSKFGWTVERLKTELQSLSKDVGKKHEDLCMYLLMSAKPTEFRASSGTDWFADVKSEPVPEEGEATVRIKLKVSSPIEVPLSVHRC
jgi:hypothetical protein